MKFRTKVSLGLVGLALMTNGLLLVVLYYQARESLLSQIQSTVLSVASTTARLIDVERLSQIRPRADDGSPAYREIESFLRQARDANRRDDVRVKFLYVIAPDEGQVRSAHYVVEAEEEGPDKSHFGEAYKSMDAATLDFDAVRLPSGVVNDQWGTWLTALVPIRDGTGHSIGLVGADVNAGDVVARLRRLLASGLAAMLLSALLAVIVALVEARRLSAPLGVIGDAVRSVGKGELNTRVIWESNDEFAALARAINEMIEGLRQRDNLKQTLAHYVSREVADEILTSGRTAELKGERRKITVLFADVRGFTSLAETLSPEQVVSLLNEYFDRMIDAIFRHKGTLNKFLGDGFMAIFGAPLEDAYQEEHAIAAALEMHAAARDLQGRFAHYGVTDFRIGIGINTGIAVVGNIGCTERMEYTAIGDTVNTASRLEATTKALKVDTLVSEFTHVAVRDRFRFGPRETLQMKGKAETMFAYPVEGLRSS